MMDGKPGKPARKILFLMALNFWSIAQGKGAPSIFNTINGYVQAGWDVHVLMREASPNFGSEPPNLHIHHFDYSLLNKLFRVPHLSALARLLLWKVTGTRFLREGARIIGREGIDVLYAYEVDGVPAASRLSRRFGIPFVARYMGTVLADKLHSRKYRIALRHHFVALRTRADLVIMTNDGTQGRWVLDQLGNDSPDIRFWLNGVNRVDLSGYDAGQVRALLGVPESCRTLLCVSRLVGWKRLDRSLRAFRLVSEAYHGDLWLVVVGDGEMKQQLMELARSLGIAERVVFTGGLTQSQVYHAMNFADVFLSLYDLSNMGNPLFEAMRIGKPIITMDNGDTATIIENGVNGLLLASDSTDETIAEAILSVLNDSEMARRLAERAAEYADSHFRTWPERIAEEVELVGRLGTP